MTITHDDLTYEIVDSIPAGYDVWFIGDYAPKGYIPLCEPITPGSFKINPNTLKAIKTEHAKEIMEASAYIGISDMEWYVKHNANARPGTEAHRAVQKIKRALPYIKQLIEKEA